MTTRNKAEFLKRLHAPRIACPKCGRTLWRLAAYGLLLNVHAFVARERTDGSCIPLRQAPVCEYNGKYLTDAGNVWSPMEEGGP